MDSSAPLSTTDMLLETLNESGAAPRRRIKDARSLHQVYSRMRKADEGSAINRQKVQRMFDGEPPYDESQLLLTNQSDRANLDFGVASGLMEKSMSAYIDMVNATEVLVSGKTLYGETGMRQEWEDKIFREITTMIRSWRGFNYRFLRLCHHFIGDGIGIAYRETPVDWRFRVSSLDGFYLPRQSEASEDEIEIACCVRSYTCGQLYEFIQHGPEVAKNLGWNYEAVKKAIIKAKGARPAEYDDWDKVSAEIKNNDIYEGATSSEIKVVHAWTKEFDGTYTHYIIQEDDELEDFLFEKQSRFKSSDHAFIIFTYGIGSNGLYHSIRGLGYKIYPHVQEANRLRCQMLDAARISGSILVQPDSEESAENLSLVYYGPFAVMAPGLKMIENRTIPNYSNSVIPILSDFDQQIANRTGQYTENIFNDGKERTRFEVAAELEHLAKISVASLHLFYEPLDRLFREMVRRIIDREYLPNEPGGEYVRDLKLRLTKQDVPLEALYSIDIKTVKAVRAVGAGSQAARALVASELKQTMGSLDEVGQKTVLRETFASLVGWDNVDKYVPRLEGPRETADDKFAKLENLMMQDSTVDNVKQVPVNGTDIATVHLRIHVGLLDEYAMSLESGQTDMMQVIPIMSSIHSHCTVHLQQVEGDQLIQEEFGMWNQRLQQLSEIIYNGVKHIQKLQKQDQEQQQQSPEAAPTQGEDVKFAQELERSVLEHRVKLQQSMDEHQMKLNMAASKAAQDRALADAKAAADIKRNLLR